jgi:hypothetical protein
MSLNPILKTHGPSVAAAATLTARPDAVTTDAVSKARLCMFPSYILGFSRGSVETPTPGKERGNSKAPVAIRWVRYLRRTCRTDHAVGGTEFDPEPSWLIAACSARPGRAPLSDIRGAVMPCDTIQRTDTIGVK